MIPEAHDAIKQSRKLYYTVPGSAQDHCKKKSVLRDDGLFFVVFHNSGIDDPFSIRQLHFQ